MRKKIVHVINDFPSKSETFIVNHIVETIKRGYDPILLVNNLKPLNFASQEKLFEDYNLYERAISFNSKLPSSKILKVIKAFAILIKNIGYASVLFRTLNKKYGKKSRSLKMWFQAASFLNYKDADCFHAHFGICGKLVAEMIEVGAIKTNLITTFYGIDTFSTEENRESLAKAYSNLFHFSNRIITSSNYLANNLRLLNAPSEKLVVNPVGVDVNKFKFQHRKIHDELNLVTVGRLIKLKGQHLGIRAVKILVDRGYKINYTIVGTGDTYNNLKNLIKHLELEDFITLKQSKSQNEVIDILNRSHLFLMTSTTDDFGRAEGQGLVTAEAQATGIPAVGFNFGGVPETILHGKTGFIVSKANEVNLANSIEKFIKAPALISQMGEKARELVERNFNSEIQSKRIIDLYNAN